MKVLLFFSTLFGVTGILFLHFFAEAQEECDRISDQCADAGFAWEASGKLLLVAAVFILLVGLIIRLVRNFKVRLK